MFGKGFVNEWNGVKAEKSVLNNVCHVRRTEVKWIIFQDLGPAGVLVASSESDHLKFMSSVNGNGIRWWALCWTSYLSRQCCYQLQGPLDLRCCNFSLFLTISHFFRGKAKPTYHIADIQICHFKLDAKKKSSNSAIDKKCGGRIPLKSMG